MLLAELLYTRMLDSLLLLQSVFDITAIASMAVQMWAPLNISHGRLFVVKV